MSRPGSSNTSNLSDDQPIVLPAQSMLSVLQAHKSCLAQPSSNLFRQVESQFANNASVVYVPTGAGGQGTQFIAEFIKLAGSRSHLIEKEDIISRTFGTCSVIEESILVISHSDPIEWLLPGVRPTKRQLTVPLVIILHFDADCKIISKRVYWDQATVLRQASILPRSLYCKANSTEVTLPVLDSSIEQGVRMGKAQPNQLLLEAISGPLLTNSNDAQTTPLKTYAQGIIPQGEEPIIHPSPARLKSSVFSTEPEEVTQRYDPNMHQPNKMSALLSGEAEQERIRPSSRVLQQPGGRPSDIFSQHAEPYRTAVAIDPRRFSSQINFGSENNEPVANLRIQRRDPNYSSISSLNEKGNEIISRNVASNRTNKSHFSFGNEDQHVSPLHTGKKMNPASNESQFTFANKPQDPPPISRSGRRDPNAQSQENVERPSSRVLRAPGGGSSFSFS